MERCARHLRSKGRVVGQWRDIRFVDSQGDYGMNHSCETGGGGGQKALERVVWDRVGVERTRGEQWSLL